MPLCKRFRLPTGAADTAKGYLREKLQREPYGDGYPDRLRLEDADRVRITQIHHRANIRAQLYAFP